MRHTYHLEIFFQGKWVTWTGGECTREWGMGWLDAHREGPRPHNGWRLVREDGKVVFEVPECSEVGIGMVAGWPTWDQYAWSAQRALVRAGQIANMHKEFLVAAELTRLAGLTETVLKKEKDNG